MRILIWPACFSVVFAAVHVHIAKLPPNHDNEWLLRIAQRMLDGGTYGKDFIEINPPFAAWINLPPAAFSRTHGTELYPTFIFYVAILIGISTGLAIKPISKLSHGRGHNILMLAYASSLALLPGFDFGQREHLAIILALPGLLWLSLAQPENKVRPGRLEAFSIWLSAVGLLIKPFLILMPLAVLARRLWHQPLSRNWHLSALPFGIAPILYVTIVTYGYPEYWAEAALHGQTYFGYDKPWPIVINALKEELLGGCLVFCLMYLHRDSTSVGNAQTMNLALAALMGLVSALLQKKGWFYHALPAFIIMTFTMVLMTTSCLMSALGSRGGVDIALCGKPLSATTITVLYFGLLAKTMAWSYSIKPPPLIAILQKEANNKSLLMMSTSLIPGLLTMPGTRLAARAPVLGDLGGVVKLSEGTVTDREKAKFLQPWLIQSLNTDIENLKPDVIVVDESQHKQSLPEGFDILTYFLKDDGFRRLWEHYTLQTSITGYDIYKRSSNLNPPD